MNVRVCHACVIAILLLALSPLAHAQNKSPVAVPPGTTVGPLRYADDQPALDLKPEEQVAFLYVYGIWFLEQECLDKDSGIGRLATLGELIKGVKTPDGRVIGLSVSPVKDTNYRYEILIIGNDCVIQAVPRVKGLNGLAAVGSPTRMTGDFFYGQAGADMTKAVKLTEMGYSGNGFRR